MPTLKYMQNSTLANLYWILVAMKPLFNSNKAKLAKQTEVPHPQTENK